MRISWLFNCLALAILTIALGPLSCGEKESDSAPEQQTSGEMAATPDSVTPKNRVAMVIGGGGKSDQDSLRSIDPATYINWVAVQHENVKALCPPDHVHRSELDDLAASFALAVRSSCRFLGMTVPTDTITVLYYTGPGHGRDITGMGHAFVLGDTLHYWQTDYIGATVMKYLLPKWQDVEPRHEFLKHGIIALLDNSGINYHKRTLSRYDGGMFDHLEELAESSEIDSDEERIGSATAASFVDFVAFRYGADKLADLYRSQDEFGVAVRNIFGISADSLEVDWMGVLREVVPTMEESNE